MGNGKLKLLDIQPLHWVHLISSQPKYSYCRRSINVRIIYYKFRSCRWGSNIHKRKFLTSGVCKVTFKQTDNFHSNSWVDKWPGLYGWAQWREDHWHEHMFVLINTEPKNYTFKFWSEWSPCAVFGNCRQNVVAITISASYYYAPPAFLHSSGI